MKFTNKSDFDIRVASLNGHVAVFKAGETLEVPKAMKAACLAKNLSLVEGTDEDVPEETPAYAPQLAERQTPKKSTSKKKAPSADTLDVNADAQ